MNKEKSNLIEIKVGEDYTGNNLSGFEEIVDRGFRQLVKMSENHDLITGIPTGFHDLDSILDGLQPSNLIIVAGRPSMGKTSFAVNIAAFASIHSVPKNKVLFFSLDSSAEQLTIKMLCSESHISLSEWKRGNIDQTDRDNLALAKKNLSSASIEMIDTPNLSPENMRLIIQESNIEGGIDLVVIDYLQLMTLGRAPTEGKNELDEIIVELKRIAREFDIPILVLSQLNRALENRSNHRPEMRDLRGSGYIESLADVILFLYRDEVYDLDSDDKGIADVIIAKHKYGPTGVVRLKFIGKYHKFSNLWERERDFRETAIKNSNNSIFTLINNQQLLSEIQKWALREKRTIIEGEPYLTNDNINQEKIQIFIIDRSLMGKEDYNLWLKDNKNQRKKCATFFIDSIRNVKLPNHGYIFCFDPDNDFSSSMFLNALENLSQMASSDG